MFRRASQVGILILILGVSACSKKTDDRALSVLKEYVSKSFAVVKPDDLKELQGLTSGNLRAELDRSIHDESLFKSAFVDEKRVFDSMKVKDQRQITPNKETITYELTYRVKTAASEDIVTTKKHATFIEANGHWMIDDVQTLKTFVDHQLEEKIAAQEGK